MRYNNIKPNKPTTQEIIEARKLWAALVRQHGRGASWGMLNDRERYIISWCGGSQI